MPRSFRFVTMAVSLAAGVAAAQVSQPSPLNPPTNGPVKTSPGQIVVIADHVHTEPGAEPINAAIVIDGGAISRVVIDPDGQDWPGARVMDMGAAHIYAGFIDAHQGVDAPKPEADSPGAHWSELVTPQRRAVDGTLLSEGDKKKLRALGFTAAAAAPKGGIFAGRAAVVSLAGVPAERSERPDLVHRADAYHALSLSSSGWGSRSYPTSQMGAISLIRQTLLDADWLGRNPEEARPGSALLDLTDMAELPLVVRTRDELEVLRAAKLADEFARPLMVVGSGTEFRRLDAIAELAGREGFGLIVPLTVPDKPNVSTVGHADAVNLRTLMTWEQAPTNARRLHDAGLRVALTSGGLRSGESFAANLTHALKVGLEPEVALAMLTTHPASMLGLDDDMGTIESGKHASFVVATGDLFSPRAREAKKHKARVLDVWIEGRRHAVSQPDAPSLDGQWAIQIPRVLDATLEVDGSAIKILEESGDGTRITTKARSVNVGPDGTISFLYDNPRYTGQQGATILSGVLTADGSFAGTAISPNGNRFNWTATRSADAEPDALDPAKTFQGDWNALLSDRFALAITIEKDGDDWSGVISERRPDGSIIEQDAASVVLVDDALTVTFDHEPFGDPGVFTLTATLTGKDRVEGSGTTDSGREFTWVAARGFDVHLPPEQLPGHPFGAYAAAELPPQETVLFRSAVIWTMGEQGVIDDGDLLIENGKIAYVGPSKAWTFKAGEEPVIVTAGSRRGQRHITPGIIDAHSHTGISRGVNEAGQAVTSEVRIGDVTNPDSINWYRQLAGGVTAVNSMHGSANPIGGQTQTNKVRWGVSHPDAMHFENAKPGIKFALGENVKQSNWGNEFRTRYPQTRMGVETIMRDRFNAARAYAGAGSAKRRDLELDALVEILEGDRWIHCHSYRQDEILMLCKIAADYGFKIGTFQHGLEVYKVAEHVRENAVGASLFSDWWAFKIEVQDAIAYAGPLQASVGVLTSYNSDSDELARRMNAEAAKAFKYAEGALTKEQALAFITINPAIQLGIDDRVGSLEVGKDADLVMWTRDPLDTFTRCLSTYVDGRELFSTSRDRELRAANADHRKRIIQRLLGEPKDEPSIEEPDSEGEELIDGDDPERLASGEEADALRDATLDMIRLGQEPGDHKCGDCGTSHIHLSNIHADSHGGAH